MLSRNLKKVCVTLETVSPAFLAGSSPRSLPEIRAPSFRGVMRFWLRALLGGVVGDNPKEIFMRESAVFGSTEHASPITIRVKQESLKKERFSDLAKWNEQKRSYEKQGIAYLFFSARRIGQEQERAAICADQKFTIEILPHSKTQTVNA
ncbi:MAG: type III-B CRISPR module RAMP protein Cmr1, partial [Deltaproteobacteria bacterium]|nr:type III-B CRISPR module RAMP protein Cmr1 [Deltaproteobacteria bacterium]